MKKTLIIIVIALIAAYVVKRMVVDPYLWKKAIATPEHALKLGSFVFSKRRGHNGSQSMENQYFILKVTEIQGDYVRMAVIRKLKAGDQIVQGIFPPPNGRMRRPRAISKTSSLPVSRATICMAEGRATIRCRSMIICWRNIRP